MRGLHEGKRVSWASDLNLRQVRLFLSEDCPSEVGLGAQDHLQAKASWLLHSTGLGSDDTLPPGFEVAHPENQWQIKLSQIPVNQWRCPPKVSSDIVFSFELELWLCKFNKKFMRFVPWQFFFFSF